VGTGEIIAIASAIVAALCAAVGKLWLENVTLRKEAATERERAQALEATINHEHKRDLRWVLGIPTSLDPPPRSTPPLLIRDERPEPPRPRKKPRT
jgi:type II secretory pathway pseudopilin PulG